MNKKEIYEDWTKTGVIDDEKGLSKKYYKQEMDKLEVEWIELWKPIYNIQHNS